MTKPVPLQREFFVVYALAHLARFLRFVIEHGS